MTEATRRAVEGRKRALELLDEEEIGAGYVVSCVCCMCGAVTMVVASTPEKIERILEEWSLGPDVCPDCR